MRVNNYTDVHAVAELSDGQLYVVKTYVKASGGCSAPAAKNADEAKAPARPDALPAIREAPRRRLRAASREAQIMIGHPNNSGLQMDQVTQLYIPAFFVNELRLWQDDSPVLSMEGGISISEDPNIRFTYVSNGAKRFRAEAKDTDGHVFRTNGRSRIPGCEAATVMARTSPRFEGQRRFARRCPGESTATSRLSEDAWMPGTPARSPHDGYGWR